MSWDKGSSDQIRITKVFSERDFQITSLDEIMYRRINPEGKPISGEPNLTPDQLKRFYELMLLGRAFDEKAIKMSTLREIGTFGACRGQEATQIGFITALERRDWFVPMYRDSAAMIAFGLPPSMLLQYYSGDERGMKIPDGINMLPIPAPVSTQLPHAVGIAMSRKVKESKAVVLTSTGDGGTSKADFHEALNFAGVYWLPVVFAVENNQWAISVRRERQTASRTLAQKALAYGFEGIIVDGNDVIACYEATKYAVEKARHNGGPTLIEFYTYRMGPHTTAELVSNKLKAPEEVAEWEKKDPILRLERYMEERGIMDDEYKRYIHAKVQETISRAVEEFRSIKPPDPIDMFMHVYDKPTPRLIEQMQELFDGTNLQSEEQIEYVSSGPTIRANIRNAINMALRIAMQDDDRIVVFGEDVGKNGGVFQVTRGLQDEFGPDRVFDTPVAELGIAGIFVGLSIGGMIPVAEFQFDGFTPPAFDQIYSHVSRMRNRSRGRFTVRGVMRFPYGAGIKAPENHSDSPETHFVHIPGLKVVVPSNPYDAKGLLLSALEDENPVIFMEPKRLYDSPKMDIPEGKYKVPLGKAKIVREGEDITIISYGAMMIPALEASNELSRQSISAEIIDLRTLSPLDTETIIRSVKKTGRLIVVHEAHRNCGIGAEIVSIIAENAIDYLKAPVRRVTGFDTVIPLAKLEDIYLPNKERIVKAANAITRY